jgi:ATP adenylyltransferase/5',5'''-P-1,P-4-tetraphosphate phosphorylase II
MLCFILVNLTIEDVPQMALLARAIACSEACLKSGNAFRLFLPNQKRVVDQSLVFIIHYFNKTLYPRHAPIARHTTRDPLLPPYPPDVEIAHLQNGADHYAFVNRGMIVPGHIVVSSADHRATQDEHLNLKDCSAFAQVLKGYGNKGIAYFNRGVQSGCSQMHKHLQCAPLTDNPLFDAMRLKRHLPWKYFSMELYDIQANDILKVYQEGLQKLKHNGSYNVIISRGVMAIVPRRKADHPCGVSANSLGVSGHLFAWEGENLFAEEHPAQLLTDLCVPI